MNRQELLIEVRKLKEKFKLEDVTSVGFLAYPDNIAIAQSFEKNKISDEKWHQFVRFAWSDPSERMYMYERVLRLVRLHKRSIGGYFAIKTEEGTFHLPDRQADLNRLLLLFQEYFDIYKSIINQIHFDYPSRKIVEKTIRGKINWDRTIRSSLTKFPTDFHQLHKENQYVTPDNILLVLAAIWLNKESNRLMNLEFQESLNKDEKYLLSNVYEGTTKIISHFPYHQVMQASTKLRNLPYDDKLILYLESQSESRIRNGVVRNKR